MAECGLISVSRRRIVILMAGPLLWHFENSPTTSSKGEGSIELSLDEVKELARAVGFDIQVCPDVGRG